MLQIKTLTGFIFYLNKKGIITIATVLTCFIASAQKNEDTNWVYIDSVRYDLSKTFISPKNVKNVYAEQHPDDTIYTTHKSGKRYLVRKKKSPIVSISSLISQMRNNNKIPNNEVISVSVDGVLLINPEEYYIEESFIKKLTIVTSPPEERNDHKYHGTSIIIKTKKKQ